MINFEKYPKNSYIEAYIQSSESETYRFRYGELEDIKIADSKGIGVRVFYNGKCGSFYSSNVKDKPEEMIENAFKNIKYYEEEAHTPDPSQFTVLREFSDELIDSELITGIEDKIKMLANNGRRFPKAAISKSKTDIKIYNNLGLNLEDGIKYFNFYSFAKADNGINSETSHAYDVKNSLKDIDFAQIIKRSSDQAYKMLGAKAHSSIDKIMFDNEVAVDILGVLTSSFSAKNYLDKKVFLKPGDVFSPLLNITDNGFDQKFNMAFDGEGIRRTKTDLIKTGEFKNLLHNTNTSRKMDAINTGNASRNSLSSIGISASSIYIEKGDKSLEDINKEHKRYFLVKNLMGLHTINKVTGDFSLGASGYIHEEGNLIPVRGVTVSGNLKDILKNIIGITDEVLYFGNYGSPKILLEGIKVSG